MRWSSALYAGPADRAAPLVSSLFVHLEGLPPIFVQAAARDALLDDATRLTERARSAGVPVTLDVWPETFHNFQLAAPVLPEAARAVERAGTFARNRLGATPGTDLV